MSAGLAVTLIGLVITAITAVKAQAANGQSGQVSAPVVLHWILIGLLFGLAFFAIQTFFEYRRKTHDPTWVLKYQEQFDSPAFVEKRVIAAKTLLKNLQDSNNAIGDEVDDVLDFFEDLGFYCKGDQISPEVIHHHFYYWLQPYFQATEQYVKGKRIDDPAQWEHLDYISDLARKIEALKSKTPPEKLRAKASDLKDFLEEEETAGD